MTITQGYDLSERVSGLGITPDQTLEILNAGVDAQASMLSLNDSFILMGWLFVTLPLLVPFAHYWIKRDERRKLESTL